MSVREGVGRGCGGKYAVREGVGRENMYSVGEGGGGEGEYVQCR